MTPSTTSIEIKCTQSSTDEQTQSTTNQCPECSGQILTQNDETICQDCGLVIDDQQVDRGPEWRQFDSDTRRRTGSPLTVTRHDRGLSTTIGYRKDGSGNTLSSRKRRQLARMRREQTRGRWQSKADRNLSHGLGETQRLTSSLDLSDTLRDQACQLFRSAQNEELLQGRSIESIAAASVYGVCRCNRQPLAIEDVVTVARDSRSHILSAYNALNQNLGLPVPPMHAKAYIPRLTSELDLSNDVQHRATEIATQAKDRVHSHGCNPIGIAAACIYLATQEKDSTINQPTIAKAANVSTVTLRNRRNELQPIS
jgi:transcription initiation factor TFIIB